MYNYENRHPGQYYHHGAANGKVVEPPSYNHIASSRSYGNGHIPMQQQTYANGSLRHTAKLHNNGHQPAMTHQIVNGYHHNTTGKPARVAKETAMSVTDSYDYNPNGGMGQNGHSQGYVMSHTQLTQNAAQKNVWDQPSHHLQAHSQPEPFYAPPSSSQESSSSNPGMVRIRTRGKRHIDEDTGCCSLVFLRYTLLVFNGIFWLTGAGIVALAGWMLLDKYLYMSLFSSLVYEICVFGLFSIGLLIVLTGTLGYLGGLKDSICCLSAYSFLLCVVFFAELSIGGLAYLYYMNWTYWMPQWLGGNLTVNLKSALTGRYGKDDIDTIAADNLQITYSCCGATSSNDWLAIDGRGSRLTFNSGTSKIPSSCCITPTIDCADQNLHINPSNIHYRGCGPVLEAFLRRDLFMVGGVGIGLCLVQFIGLLFTCCLMHRIKWFRRHASPNQIHDDDRYEGHLLLDH